MAQVGDRRDGGRADRPASCRAYRSGAIDPSRRDHRPGAGRPGGRRRIWSALLIPASPRSRSDSGRMASSSPRRTSSMSRTGWSSWRRAFPRLVEKPIADSIDGARRLVEAAERAGVPLLVGHHRRHNPMIRKAKEIYRERAASAAS